ncbi:MAG: SGNH/GDSL hydrolase family protein [Gemmatimonadaceae bacterium]
MPYQRYVAIGDSSTEGLDDPAGDGRFRGWADRLATHVARAQGGLLYANLAVRGRRTREILEQQLEPALAMRPDLATLFSGTNDVIRSGFDPGRVAADIEVMQRALRGAGATVLTFTLPDLADVIPLAARARARVEALNAALRDVSARTGVTLVDLAKHPVARDGRLWSDDRLHANSEGHTRIAAALAHALGLPGFDGAWAAPLPERARPSVGDRAAAELRWVRRYLLPWVWRHARGRSSGDGISAKRPQLTPVQLP